VLLDAGFLSLINEQILCQLTEFSLFNANNVPSLESLQFLAVHMKKLTIFKFRLDFLGPTQTPPYVYSIEEIIKNNPNLEMIKLHIETETKHNSLLLAVSKCLKLQSFEIDYFFRDTTDKLRISTAIVHLFSKCKQLKVIKMKYFYTSYHSQTGVRLDQLAFNLNLFNNKLEFGCGTYLSPAVKRNNFFRLLKAGPQFNNIVSLKVDNIYPKDVVDFISENFTQRIEIL
jgi:hypothetical protein